MLLPLRGVHPAALEPGDQVRLLRLRLLRRCFLKAQCRKKTRIQHRGNFSRRAVPGGQSSGSIWLFNPLYSTSATMPRQAPPTLTLTGHEYIKKI